MSLADYDVYPDADDLIHKIEQFDLAPHIVELEAYGLTIVPPEKMQASPGFLGKICNAAKVASQGKGTLRTSCFLSCTTTTASYPMGSDGNKEGFVLVMYLPNQLCCDSYHTRNTSISSGDSSSILSI